MERTAATVYFTCGRAVARAPLRSLNGFAFMPPLPLSEDEFRLLAYMRAYADHRDQSLDPGWVQEQLDFSLKQLQAAARGLAARGLADFFEWRPDQPELVPPEYGDGPMPMNLRLTHKGWDSLRVEGG